MQEAVNQNRRVIDFDHFARRTWRAINSDYACVSEAEEERCAKRAYDKIHGYIKDIFDGCPVDASFGTKKNALDTLRKIAILICSSDDSIHYSKISYPVQQFFESDSGLYEAMLSIARSLSGSERNDLLDKGGFWAKLKDMELVVEASECFEHIKDVRSVLAEGETYNPSEGGPEDSSVHDDIPYDDQSTDHNSSSESDWEEESDPQKLAEKWLQYEEDTLRTRDNPSKQKNDAPNQALEPLIEEFRHERNQMKELLAEMKREISKLTETRQSPGRTGQGRKRTRED